jgi:hypothetical protein
VRQFADAQYAQVATEALANADLELTFGILRRLYASDGPSERYARLVDQARERHGEVIALFSAVYADLLRENKLIALREKYHEPDHRFFLALLLNVPRRDLILRLVRERFPTDDPERLVEGWLRDLSGAEGLGIEFDDMTVSMYRHMASGSQIDDVLEALTAESTTGAFTISARRAAEQYLRLQGSPALRPLFVS